MEVLNSLKKHRKINRFVQNYRSIVHDTRLSWKAKGSVNGLISPVRLMEILPDRDMQSLNRRSHHCGI